MNLAKLESRTIRSVVAFKLTVPGEELFNFLSQRYGNEFPSVNFIEWRQIGLNIVDGNLTLSWTTEQPC